LIDQRHPLHVILVAARNPLNIGAAARAMANFGFAHLSVVNPYQIAFRQARSAVGASALLASAQEFSSVAEAVADCALVVGTTASRYRELKHRLETLDKGAALIRKGLKSSPTALLFGSERTGLSNDDLSHCQWLMTIPTGGMQPSMNLGQAVAVCLYEIARKGEAKAAVPARTASAGELERITSLLVEALGASGYIPVGGDRTMQEKVRRMVRRLQIPGDDAELWMGMLRQILWKLENPHRAS